MDGILKGIVKSTRRKARESFGVRRTYSTSERRKMKRNTADGLFTKPLRLVKKQNL